MSDRTNTDRQAAFKRRRRENGEVQVTVWVHETNKETIKKIAQDLLTPATSSPSEPPG